MKTYIATIETSAGTNTIQLAAANLKDAQAQIESREQDQAKGSYNYEIRQVDPMQSPEIMNELMSASGALLACLILFVAAEYKLRRYFIGH